MKFMFIRLKPKDQIKIISMRLMACIDNSNFIDLIDEVNNTIDEYQDDDQTKINGV